MDVIEAMASLLSMNQAGTNGERTIRVVSRLRCERGVGLDSPNESGRVGR